MGRFNCGNTFFIVGSVFIVPQNSSYSSEDTWLMLHEETRFMMFPVDRLVVVGDFTVHASNLFEVNLFFQMRMQKSNRRSSGCQGAVTTCLGE